MAAIAAVGGGVVAGAWFGFVRETAAQPEAPVVADATWTRPTTPTPPPSVAEVRPAEAAPALPPVTPAGATLPIPAVPSTNLVAPAIPVAPVSVPAVPGAAAPLPVPPVPAAPTVALPPVPSIEPPVAAPRIPDPTTVGADKLALPPVPAPATPAGAVVPPIPSVELPALPTPPKPDVKPVVPPPALPTLPGNTIEPPKLPVPPVVPPVAPVGPGSPVVPMLPAPTELTPTPPPIKPTGPVPPLLPVKPDSDLKPTIPGNTLNPPVSPVAPAIPITPPGTGRETPGTPVDRPKPTDPPFGTTDKFVFPLPTPQVPHHRDDTMLNITTSAAFAFLGGALLAAEQAKALPMLPPAPLGALPVANARGDAETDKLKADLKTANDKIAELEKQVKKLTEALNGKVDDKGFRLESDPGAVEEIKRLKNRIAELDTELKTLKGQTTLKPPVPPIQEIKKGIVKVINEYPVEIAIVINEKSYRVAPGTKLEVEVPLGEFTYQLLQSGAPPTKSVIKEKEPVTLRIK